VLNAPRNPTDSQAIVGVLMDSDSPYRHPIKLQATRLIPHVVQWLYTQQYSPYRANVPRTPPTAIPIIIDVDYSTFKGFRLLGNDWECFAIE